MAAPIIGVTMTRMMSVYGYPLHIVTEAYIRAVTNAGACPLLIPLGQPEKNLKTIFAKLDGILFTGGGDIHPDQYHSSPHPLVDEVDKERDQIEIFLVKESIEKNLPFLGICRGIQVINVALGGTLYEDLVDQRPASLRHSYFPEFPRQYLAHKIQIEPQSQLAGILGRSSAPVNSLHHQGLKLLAPGLRASAYAPDGLVEACEIPSHRFGLAVQWHPEWLPEEAAMPTLFEHFVAAAKE